MTGGVWGRDQGLAGALFTTGQQIGAAVGLAILATVAAVRTAHASGSLVAGYQLSFLIAAALALLAGVLVAWQLSSRDCQQELARQQSGPGARRRHPPKPSCANADSSVNLGAILAQNNPSVHRDRPGISIRWFSRRCRAGTGPGRARRSG
jgi:hypothetical protein